MSTPDPAPPAARAAMPMNALDDDGNDETTPLLIYVVVGVLGLVLFLALVGLALFFLFSLTAATPLGSGLLTPTP